MDKKLKDKWVKALMSGKYEQGFGCLEYDNKFCCLGVLGKVAEVRGIADEGMLSEDSLEKCGIALSVAQQLAALNDEGAPFPVIAGFIQENL